MSNAGSAKDRLVSERKNNRDFRKMVAPLSCLMVMLVAVVFMMPAISMTHGSLVCGLDEHAHTKACYEQVLVCGQEEGEGADPETGEGGHVHTKACYEKQLVCDMPEHKHSEACYAAPEPEAANTGDGDGDTAGPESNHSGESAVQDTNIRDDSNTEQTDNQYENNGFDEGESADSESGEGIAQSFEADLKNKEGKAVLTVSVEAPEGALPEGTTMKIDGIDATKVWEPVQSAVKRAAAEKTDMQKALARAGAVDEISQMTVVDIVFRDAEGNVVEPAKKLKVRITSDMVRDMPHPAYPFLARVSGDRDAKDDAKRYADAKMILKKVKVVNRDVADKSTGAEDTVVFKADKFGPYAIMQLVDAGDAGEGGAGASEGSAEPGEQAGFNGPAMSFESDVKDADGNVVLKVSADVPENTLPEGADMRAELVESEAVIDAAKEAAAGEADIAAERSKALAADITFVDAEGNPVEPAGDVHVTMAAPAIAEQDQLAVVHVDDEANAQVVQGEDVNKAERTVAFDAASFSVYALVYTVDFHWEVGGKVYNFSMPGGGFVSFKALMEALGVAKQSAADASVDDQQESGEPADGSENADEIDNAVDAENAGADDAVDDADAADTADNSDTADAENAESDENVADAAADADSQSSQSNALSDVQISDQTAKLVADVAKVEFSNPDLLWVGKIEADTTVGSLKETNGLDCQYSAELTDEQKEEIDAQQVSAGDWALISLKAFNTEEALTVTMNDGSAFTIRVTDAQDPSIFAGKEVIIYDNTEKQAMTSNYATDYRTHFNTIPEATADNDSNAHWKIEQTNGGYYLRSNDGKYLYLDHTNVRLVNNAREATVLTIEPGGNPDYRIYAANNRNNVLRYCENNQYDGFFSAVDGTNNAGNSREWLYIREAAKAVEPVGDWLLYFDDDSSEITVHVGETITLRPYNKWEWKEGNVDVQTAHWNVGTWSDWNISSSDQNGSKQDKKTDGPFEFTRYVKQDDQLTTHYWAVQGRATQTGDYTLTNTKNGKTITVHVIDGAPVNKPNTINKIANIKVNLFDYDNGGALDAGMVNGQANHNLANDSNFKNESVNQMGGSDHFYFLSSGSGTNNNEKWNNYTKDAANPNIVKDTLDSAGYPVLNHGNQTSLKYLFDTSKTTWHGGSGNNGMIAYPDVVGMFQKDSAGYYYFNSNTNYYYYDTASGTSKLYEHTYTQTSGASKGSLFNDKPIGFFPFHDYDATDNLYVNQNKNLNHHVGMSMAVEFMLPNNRLDDNGEPIIFDFSGDDDLWVFVEWIDDNGVKQSKRMLDLGGVHQPIHGQINFTEDTSIEAHKPYTLKVFYLERGGCDSNCSIRFNLPIIQDLTVAKKLTGLTEAEKAKYKDEEFTYEIVVNGQPYTGPNGPEKIVIRNAAGEDITPQNFRITDGKVTIKDGQTVTISYLDRSDKFSVAEVKTANMENFETPNAERYYHLEHDASLYEEEIHLTESKTLAEPKTDDWTTPTYELEDTEKVTFTNTLKEKNLEVEKKWKGEKDPPESITFTVGATVDDGNGGRKPYAVSALKEEDGTTDKVFTLNRANKWRYEIEHLPVNTPDGKFIFYDIHEGQVEGYTQTGLKDITAENYNYCNVDVVKLWPDSNGEHTEVIEVVLKNSEGKYYAGVDDKGEAKFVDNVAEAATYNLTKDNNYTHRFERVPAGAYTAEQLHEDAYTKGLATYVRNIIQYEMENSPVEGPVGPEDKPNEPEIHKRIDALRDGTPNPDSPHSGDDLTDLYRLYLDYKVKSLQEANGVDLLFVIDHSGSMNNSAWQGNPYRAPAVEAALNGENGLISEFLGMNEKNQWAAVGFKGPDGADNYYWSLGNPWQPATELSAYNAGLNGSEVLSTGGESYVFTRNDASPSGKNVTLANEGPDMLTNYTAGLWRAEQFLLKQDVRDDGRKKVVVFISDGIPTLHIDCPNGTLQGAGIANGSWYYRDAYGGCPTQTLTEFGYFVNDMTSNGYTFGGNMEFYTIGFGGTMQTESGSKLLNGMLDTAYGKDDHSGHYMTISDTDYDPLDTDDVDYSTAANTLKNDLRTIMGMNETFTNIIIQDDLSAYVDLYGLAEAGTSVADIMRAANAKVTMKVPNPDNPDKPKIVTLYENGAPANSDDAKFTRADGTTKANIIQKLEYGASSKTVKAIFDPEYKAVAGAVYTLSFDVKATEQAYTKYAAQGYDKYAEGEKQGQVIVGDKDTDFLGTDPDNATSVDKAGFRSNDEATVTYKHNGKDEGKKYPHPVIQVAAKVDIVKTDQTGAALEGAKFNLYGASYDASKTIEQNTGCLIEADLQSKKPTNPAGQDAVIRNGKLGVGTYYLVETKAPAGYNALPGPVKITVSEAGGTLTMTAEIAGQSVGDKLSSISAGVWKLSVQNTAGYELPLTGGIGTDAFYLIGIVLVTIAGAGLAIGRLRKRAA